MDIEDKDGAERTEGETERTDGEAERTEGWAEDRR